MSERVIRDIGVLGTGLWESPPIGNEVFGPEFAIRSTVRDPYNGLRGDDGIVRVAGTELIPGQHDRTIAAVEHSFTDPYRGARRRRWFPDDLLVSSAETEAATNALEDAGVDASQIGAVLVHSFLPDGINPKNATKIADNLGITGCLAFEVESVCSSTLSQMMVAGSLIAAGQADYVLCTQSIAYSRLRDPNASTTVFEADMASAFVMGRVPGCEMAFSFRTVGGLHGAISLEWRRPTGAPPTPVWHGPRERLHMSFDRELQKKVNADVAEYAKITTAEALGKAERRIEDVEIFISHQPMSWFRPYMEDTLGLADGVAYDTFEEYANINSPSVTASIHEARKEGRLRRGANTLLYCPAAGYTYGAVAMRW